VAVCTTVPGAVLLPWSDAVDAITMAFMPGQEYGHALSDLLFGSINPSAKLPLTLPNTENEVNFTASQWPGVGGKATYSEGLLVGYRHYDKFSVVPKFAFGHGLSYTSFALSGVAATASSVTAVVSNTGAVAGVATPQLYLSFPSSAQEPLWQLKGFHKVRLAPGESATVKFSLGARDLSIWYTGTHAWVAAKGKFSAAVAQSSRDSSAVEATFTS